MLPELVSLFVAVAHHETFWARLGQRAPDSPNDNAVAEHLKAFLRDHWDAFYDKVTAAEWTIGKAPRAEQETFARHAAERLTQLRADAVAAYELPVPEMSKLARADLARLTDAGESDAVAVRGRHHERDPLEAEIDRRTDLRFWDETGLPHGYRLDPHGAYDKTLINTWLSIRYQVAQDVAAANANGGDADQVAASGDIALMGKGGGGGGARPPAYPRQSFDTSSQATDTAPPEVSMLPFDPDQAANTNPTGTIVGFRGSHDHGGGRRGRGRGGYGYGYGGGYGGDYVDVDLIDVAPVLTVTDDAEDVQFHVDGNTLHATICVGGKCYSGSTDLSAYLGSAAPASVPEAVQAAGEAIVGALVDQHRDTVMAGWWESFTHAISSAAHGIAHGAEAVGSGVAHTLKALKGPITIAAAGVATALAGPAGGAMAKLTGSLIDAANGDGSAQAVIAQAQQAAASNPTIANALGVAQQAVATTTTGYHIAQTVANAASGNKDAQTQVMQLATAAAQGDVAAKRAMAVANAATLIAKRNTGNPAGTAAAAAQYLAPHAQAAATDAGTGDGDASYQGADAMPVEDTGTPDAEAAVQGIALPLLAALAGFGAGYFGPGAYEWAKAQYLAKHGALPAGVK